jgi:FPC/CPF motif-containing protein YcgG
MRVREHLTRWKHRIHFRVLTVVVEATQDTFPCLNGSGGGGCEKLNQWHARDPIT